MYKFHQRLWCSCPSERGASMVEYALLLALLAVVAIGAVGAFGGGLNSEFSDIGSTVISAVE